MKWKSRVEPLNGTNVQKIFIRSGERPVKYGEVIELWQDDESFRSFFGSLLADAPFKAFFLETPPVSLSTVNKDFEFVLVDSPQLALVEADERDFREYFQATTSGEQVISFPNLGNDALLVVPCPSADLSAYPHLATFVRKAPQSQQHILWQTLGQVLSENLNQRPIWVSTSGLGVHWLHIRLDSFPKYYTFAPYK